MPSRLAAAWRSTRRSSSPWPPWVIRAITNASAGDVVVTAFQSIGPLSNRLLWDTSIPCNAGTAALPSLVRHAGAAPHSADDGHGRAVHVAGLQSGARLPVRAH